MCTVCEFTQKLVPVSKEHAAINKDGSRSIWGYYDPADAEILSQFYPKTGEDLIQKISKCINHPRLLEVAGVVEMSERFLEKSFSKIRNLSIDTAINPLSVLFWSKSKGVQRIKTHETEMLHGPMEKMSLRRKAIILINELLQKRGFELTFACSCCVIAIAPDNIEALYRSDYYDKRESFGREFDSDVLTVSKGLYSGISVSEIPAEILARTSDFGQAEVQSYLRFANAAKAVIKENIVHINPTKPTEDIQEFLTGRLD